MPMNTFDDVNIVSGNGLAMSGNKPLPEPMVTSDVWCYMASPEANEL